MGCGTSSRSKVEPPSKIPPNTLGAHYHVSYVLGRGEFATVRAGMQRVTGDLVAIKTLKRSETNFNMDAIREEIDCMKRIKHPGCIKLFETFKGTDAVHIVQERGEGGDLWMRIQETGPIPERTSLHVMRQLTDAVAFLHQNGVCHRDIKPANIIMMGKRPKDPAYWTAKITDFGFSKKDVTGYFKCMKTVHGTPEFVPPEILLKMLPERVAWVSGLEQPSMYSAKCDVYSLGVMLYTMIAGNIPYSFEDNLPVLIQNILRQKLDFSGEAWGEVSEEVKEAIRTLMAINPAQRPNAKAAGMIPCIAEASLPGRGGKAAGEQHTDGSLSSATTQKLSNTPPLEQEEPAAESSYVSDLDRSDLIAHPSDLIRANNSQSSVKSNELTATDLEMLRNISDTNSLDSLKRAEFTEVEQL
mmetsp:Transcript_27023/g.64150  ORF Transcript_27023/g.64150 Transcript_27023/m.64150 type:complete len:414 (-) Transcript_27023:43-1284(-)